jgi:DNA-binding PadR family transcriptional regulator
MKLSVLDALLLFLVSHKGQSGYDIRQLFQSSPIGIFSDSPGAIYPALARLEMRGLLASTATDAGRRRRVYERTPTGEAALDAWLLGPIEADAMARRPQDLDLRFVIVAERLGGAEAKRFLVRYQRALQARQSEVIAYRDGPGQAIGAASLAAMDLGVSLGAARLQWCADQISKLGGTDDEDESARRPGA